MAQSIYIGSVEGNTGKSTVALGVLDALRRRTPRVGVFRPIARSSQQRDYVLDFLIAQDGVEVNYDDAIGVDYETMHFDPEAALATIVSRYRAFERHYDAVVVIGSDYTDVVSPAEFAVNARIAANLGTPMLLVLNGRATSGEQRLGQLQARSAHDVALIADQAVEQVQLEHATIFGIIVNRAEPTAIDEIARLLSDARPQLPCWVIPEDRYLVAPTVANVLTAVGGSLTSGDPELLGREALGVVIAGMSLNNVLDRLIESSIVIIPADRTEVLIGVLTAQQAATFPSVSGIVLNGGFVLPEPVVRLMQGLRPELPIITTPLGTYETAAAVMDARGRLAAESQRKRDTALALFVRHVDAEQLFERMNLAESAVVTPLMFEYGLFERARSDRKRIVLPEGEDDRILRAAATLLARDVAELTLLGDEAALRERANSLGLDLSRAQILSGTDPALLDRFATEYAELRRHKGMTKDLAHDMMGDSSYFGTMMVHLGLADGMVSGAVNTTAHTIRPALEFIKTKPGVSVVSSVFLMAMADRVLVYGDCAVNPDPNAEQLADIAISSAQTALQFGIEPRVAMLSYSTGESGSGADVDKVREATAIVRERQPELLVAGPIQYDAAADASVAAAKMPGDPVAGRATVFIFPDLNTGNNTYKAVQRSAGAVAIGPVLQGLNKPVNDLSRGALVNDIVNTVAITAIQAQGA